MVRFAKEHSLWLLAVVPALVNFTGTILLPEFSGLLYLYFALCFVFLLWDVYLQKLTLSCAALRLLLGLLLFPAYLIRYRRGSGWQLWGPIAAWTILFVFYLALVSIQ